MTQLQMNVALGQRSYAIHIGPGLIADASLYREALRGQQVMVVTNETVAPLYLQQVLKALEGHEVDSVVLPDGESYKTMATVGTILDRLLERGFSRDCAVVALGGGVVGDMAGFAAATYQRGVDFLQVPTTLLAQVDSSVGGKTGVNHPLGKNMIGAFHQPRVVIADTDTLATLPDRELRAGLAEVIKYGVVADAEFFDWLEAHVDRLLARDDDAMAYAIHRSCENKARIVAEDEREAGRRALLNLGHTFGHAIEAGMGYGEWLHGEAVAAGMCMAAELSRRLQWLDDESAGRVLSLVDRAGLPVDPPAELSAQRMRSLMARDKKVAGGRLRLVLLHGMGNGVVTADYDEDALMALLRDAARQSA